MKREDIVYGIRLTWQSEFGKAVRRLLEGWALLYIFLVTEDVLVDRARAGLTEAAGHAVAGNSIVIIILNGIEIGSALGVAILFLLHFIAVGFYYTRYIFK